MLGLLKTGPSRAPAFLGHLSVLFRILVLLARDGFPMPQPMPAASLALLPLPGWPTPWPLWAVWLNVPWPKNAAYTYVGYTVATLGLPIPM